MHEGGGFSILYRHLRHSISLIIYLLSRDNYRTATPSPKLRQLARRDKYPLLLRLQFPNASSERRALPESGTSVLEWDRVPTLAWPTHAESRTSNRDGGRVSFSLSKRNEI